MKQSTKGAIGLPLAVQVVGRRFDEETVLRVMKEVEGLVKYERKWYAFLLNLLPYHMWVIFMSYRIASRYHK